MTESSAFHAFELAGWSDAGVVGAYDDGFGSVTIQAVPKLLAAVGAGADLRLLDVACGPGYVAVAAAALGASVTGLDFSPAMIATARAHHPAIDFREGDAQALPFPDGTFDCVVSAFGMLHFADPDAAIREAFRCLRTGGRFAFSVWAQPGANSGLGLLRSAIEEHGRLDVPLPDGPPQFRFSDEAESRRSLAAAGFVSPRTEMLASTWRAESGEAMFDLLLRSSVRMRGLLQTQTPAALAAIRAAVTASVERYRVGDGISVPSPALIASGEKV